MVNTPVVMMLVLHFRCEAHNFQGRLFEGGRRSRGRKRPGRVVGDTAPAPGCLRPGCDRGAPPAQAGWSAEGQTCGGDPPDGERTGDYRQVATAALPDRANADRSVCDGMVQGPRRSRAP